MIGKGWWAAVAILLGMSAILHHDLLFLTGLLLALIGATSHLWTRYCLARVSYGRRLGTARIFWGEETDLFIEMTNAKPLPLAWLRIEDTFPEALHLMGGRLRPYLAGRRRLIHLVSLRWYERVTRRYRLRGTRRGVWRLGPATLVSGDVFGLGVRRESVETVQTLVVYPKHVPITALGLPAQHPFGEFSTRQRVLADPLRLMGTRDYRPGDSYRYIHWKATARQPALQTKVFEPSASRPLAIFLNVNTYERIYEGLDRDLQEYAITAAASVARHAHEAGHHVGLYVNSVAWPNGERVRIRPGNHPEQLVRIFEALAGVAEYGRWGIEALLDVEARQLPYGTTLVVITAIVNDRLCRTLAELRRREYAVALIALGEGRLETPLPGVRYYYIGAHEAWHGLETLHLAQ